MTLHQCLGGWATDPRLVGRPSDHLTSVSCSSLLIVYFRIFCLLRLIRMPKTTPIIMTSRVPTTAAMIDVTGLRTEAKVRGWGPVLGRRDEGTPWKDMKVTVFGKGIWKSDPQASILSSLL